jgi:hypothetical protein
MAELQEMHPTFFKMCEHEEILPRTGDPIQLDSVLLRGLREKVGIRIETDDITEAAALLNIDEEDPIFRSEHSKAHPS